jgi:dethiobiotin synthetase
MLFSAKPSLRKPGLFITGTDTGVGKTLVTCGVAWCLRAAGSPGNPGNPGPAASSRTPRIATTPGFAETSIGPAPRVGVCKPFATGCRHDREGLVGADAEALAHFSDCRQPLAIINPVRYAPPLAPAAAAELTGKPVDFDLIARSLTLLDAASDCLLIEGVGGLLVPLAPRAGSGAWRSPATRQAPPPAGLPEDFLTVLDLAAALGYPVLVVARAGLGTLSHTAMTIALLRQARCRIAGIVVNGYLADPATAGSLLGAQEAQDADISMSTNRLWLERMNRAPILATIPACPPAQVDPARGRIPPAVLEALAVTYWPDVLVPPDPAA